MTTKPFSYSIGIGTSLMMAIDFHSALIGLAAVSILSMVFVLGRLSIVADNT